MLILLSILLFMTYCKMAIRRQVDRHPAKQVITLERYVCRQTTT